MACKAKQQPFVPTISHWGDNHFQLSRPFGICPYISKNYADNPARLFSLEQYAFASHQER